jgi:pyruvate,water dikinase
LLESWEDVFFLELEELMSFCDGTATLVEPRALVTPRKQEFRRFEAAAPPPDRFVTHGTTVASQRIADGPAPDSEGLGALRGLTAYPGLVEEPAVVMLQPDTQVRLEGEILVTRQTDPGWVILFPSIGGLVVERGSMLSHSAIVAREMGIPTIVGVRGATEAIKTGDRLRMDAAAGTVQVLKGAPEGATP